MEINSHHKAVETLKNRTFYARRIADFKERIYKETVDAFQCANAEGQQGNGSTPELDRRIDRLYDQLKADKAAWDEAQADVRALVLTPRDRV